jgi:hypothetical protein
MNASIVSLSSKRDQTYCARRYPYARDLLNSNFSFRSSNLMVRTDRGSTLCRIGRLTLGLTVLPRERQPLMCAGMTLQVGRVRKAQ